MAVTPKPKWKIVIPVVLLHLARKTNPNATSKIPTLTLTRATGFIIFQLSTISANAKDYCRPFSFKTL
jgi:hypothetical protein